MFLIPLESRGWSHSELHSHLASRCCPQDKDGGTCYRSPPITFSFWGLANCVRLVSGSIQVCTHGQEVGRKSLSQAG